VHIFICRNCGKLTESENRDEKVCSSCGAPLDPLKPDSKEAAQARLSTPGGPAPIRLPTARPSTSQARTPPPRPTSAPPPTPPRPPNTPASQAPARSTQVRPVELPSDATPPPQTGRPPPRPVTLPSSPTPPPTARDQLRTVEEPETKSEEKEPAVAGETSTEDTIIPTQSPVDAGPEGMEVFENKDLVACPQCGYGCDPNWGKCPLCDAPISGTGDLKKITEMDFTADEASFSKGLVPCPKCQYACDPSWGTCPICNSELKQPEGTKKPEIPAASDKPEKPENPE